MVTAGILSYCEVFEQRAGALTTTEIAKKHSIAGTAVRSGSVELDELIAKSGSRGKGTTPNDPELASRSNQMYESMFVVPKDK